ncbi:helix-turn-helix domain-containing protein [Enterococcus sp. BWR-S5]|uniref:helix-turn-helix domain-containing protein n=1 Tax=Enterococcus sp. BWR-S5 TaxID=2787714 RepID=UPI0019246142|nr:helix-turn-helix transcriptional regulator [Enterococcus sp. BWR-S5]MBL1226580.1 helix-turn-helix transcriptional regulator [Enterococcus sp. BWR-S5]
MFNTGRIKAERIAAGLTQEDIAKKMGWSRTKYSKFENGKSKTGADDLAEFAEIVGATNMNIFFNFNVPKTERTKSA